MLHIMSWLRTFRVDNKKRVHDLSIDYINVPTKELTVEQLKQCATLFSCNYGRYSNVSSRNPGEPVKMGMKYYKNNYVRDDYSVAIAIDNNNIIGQAFYIRKQYDGLIMTWIVQLVVDEKYRRKGIASTLLRSIWGFSDDFAWGLATANPCTIRTLESATMRKCKPSIIQKHLCELKKIGRDIGFVHDDSFEISKASSQINTDFDVDNSGFDGIKECENRLGKLKQGREWLAFTFQDQGIQKDIYAKNFRKLIEFSEKQLKEAYDRMPIEEQKWAKGEINEVDYILNKSTNRDIRHALDLGCGVGRHSIELAKRGIITLGIDYSRKHIDKAKEIAEREDIRYCSFICADIREYKSEKEYDLVLCLFDVVGSYPDEKDNISIIRTAYANLCVGGIFAISVMNMDLTDSRVHKGQKGDVANDPQLLLKLRPSDIMQRTGNVFDPKYIVIDQKEGLIYRKEQFSNDYSLPAEYIIRDKRYYMKEIVQLLEQEGFSVFDKRYVRAGHFDTPLGAVNVHAKEILVLCKKKFRTVEK